MNRLFMKTSSEKCDNYNAMRIALVEDEEKLAKAISKGLTQKGYAVDVMTDGKTAYKRISLNNMDYDLIILDLMLPEMSGKEICDELRKNEVTTPILVLTAKHEVENKVDLLLSGADDYLVKPFSFDELCARIKAILRRPSGARQPVLTAREIVLDPAEQKVKIRGKPVSLTLKEFVLLEHFMRNPNIVISREELLSHLWDFNFSSFSNVVDVHVKNLRKKIGTDSGQDILETVRGIGYRFKA